jgi:parallel beta-helix repeat protein
MASGGPPMLGVRAEREGRDGGAGLSSAARKAIVGAVCALAAGLLAPAASARGIEVHPGHRALQRAIDSAAPGDTLHIHAGRYRGGVTVGKPLRLVGVSGERPIVDAGCQSQNAIDINANRVRVEHLKVVGAAEGFGPYPAEVNFVGRASGRAQDLVVDNTCDAEYGINVNSSERVKVVGNRGFGFADSAIYIGNISSTGKGSLRVRDNQLFDNNRGIIVEDTVGSADVRIEGNDSHGNDIPPGEGTPAGIFVHNSDGVRFAGNRLNGNGDGEAGYGIHLDSNSDRNRLFRNVARHNESRNLLDEGEGNCGSENSFSLSAC